MQRANVVEIEGSSIKIKEKTIDDFIKSYLEDDHEAVKQMLRETQLKNAACIELKQKPKPGGKEQRFRNILELSIRKDFEMVKILVTEGSFDPNYPDQSGNTPYTLAYWYPKCLKCLFYKGGRVPGARPTARFNLDEQRILILEYNMARMPESKEKIQEKIDKIRATGQA